MAPEILVGKAGTTLGNWEQKWKYDSMLLIFQQHCGRKIGISGAISENQKQSSDNEQQASIF